MEKRLRNPRLQARLPKRLMRDVGNKMIRTLATVIVTALLVGGIVWFSMVKVHHGEMNVRVGHPYSQLMSHMHMLAEQGRTNELNSLIRKANENIDAA